MNSIPPPALVTHKQEHGANFSLRFFTHFYTIAGNLPFIDKANISVVMCAVLCTFILWEWWHICSYNVLAVRLHLPLCCPLQAPELFPHRETIWDTNTTQASTLPRRATICLRSQQSHNAAPHRGLLIESRLCSNTSLFRCRSRRHLAALLTIQGRGGSLYEARLRPGS